MAYIMLGEYSWVFGMQVQSLPGLGKQPHAFLISADLYYASKCLFRKEANRHELGIS